MAKTQWHPAFCAAMRLELKENSTLQFSDSFHLSEKPLEVDLLIINKPSDTRIHNQIGEFFGGHNVLEYKSPADHDFNGLAVSQALSYAYYYCDRYKTWDVTVSLVVSKERFSLLPWMASQGFRYTKRHEGIYTIQGINFLRMQIIVTEELDGETFKWLSALTDRMTERKARDFVGAAHELTENEDRRLAESIVQVITSANEGLFEKMKEDEKMASALFELMRPEVEKFAQDYAKERDAEHIKAMIQHGDDNAYIKQIMNVTDEEIEKLRGLCAATV